MEKRSYPYNFFRLFNIRAVLVPVAFSLFFSLSCSNKTVKSRYEESADSASAFSAHHAGGRNVVLFLGHDFVDAEKKQNLTDYLDRTYGLFQNGGLISILSYPEDVRVAGKIRLSLLSSKLTELHERGELSAFITVGAPQGIHSVLASLQDGGTEIPVFSIFSQDDVLGTEAGSDLVIDYRTAPVKNEADVAHDSAEDADLEYKGDFGAVLSPLTQVILNWGEMKESPMLVPLLRREFFKQTGCNLVIYTDPVTGLRSKNHYVLEGIPREKQ